jgi:hypothetical protein
MTLRALSGPCSSRTKKPEQSAVRIATSLLYLGLRWHGQHSYDPLDLQITDQQTQVPDCHFLFIGLMRVSNPLHQFFNEWFDLTSATSRNCSAELTGRVSRCCPVQQDRARA